MKLLFKTLFGLSLFSAAVMADEAQLKVAKELLLSFGSGDSSYADKVLGTNYIQHNQHYEDGRDALLSAIPHLKGTETKVLAGFVDSEFAVVLSEDYFKGDGGIEQNVAFDIFRFEGGKIVEHWDNIAPKASVGEIPSLTSSVWANAKTSRTLAKRLIEASIEPDYKVLHSESSAIGGVDWRARLERLSYIKLHKVLSSGNLALVISEGIETSLDSKHTDKSPTKGMGGKRVAIYDLFQVKNGEIVAHFGITEEILGAANAANSNGKLKGLLSNGAQGYLATCAKEYGVHYGVRGARLKRN